MNMYIKAVIDYDFIKAAHCFYDSEHSKLYDANKYVIMVAKISREYNQNETIFQKSYEVLNYL